MIEEDSFMRGWELQMQEQHERAMAENERKRIAEEAERDRNERAAVRKGCRHLIQRDPNKLYLEIADLEEQGFVMITSISRVSEAYEVHMRKAKRNPLLYKD